MPNYCRNHLKITGTYNHLNMLLSYFDQETLSRERCLNLERLANETDRDLDCRFFIIDNQQREGNLLIIEATTAWTPTFEPFIYLSSLLPSLAINYSYYENGVGLMGKACIHGGDKNEWIISLNRAINHYPINAEALFDFLKAD